jgi:TonB family protein
VKNIIRIAIVAIALSGLIALAQEASGRRVKHTVTPAYPELAKKMQVAGAVKLEVTVESNGKVKDVKVLGGHPLLAAAAQQSVKGWEYEPGSAQTVETAVVNFKN